MHPNAFEYSSCSDDQLSCTRTCSEGVFHEQPDIIIIGCSLMQLTYYFVIVMGSICPNSATVQSMRKNISPVYHTEITCIKRTPQSSKNA